MQNIEQLAMDAYRDFLVDNPIVPEAPSRKSFRRNLQKQNPDFAFMENLFLSKYVNETDEKPTIVGKGTFGKIYRRKHDELMGSMRLELFESNILERIMEFNPDIIIRLYCLYRLNSLADLRFMRRSYVDNISKKGYNQMKMFGLILFLGKRFGTSTHNQIFNLRCNIIKGFMMYVSNRMCSSNNINIWWGLQICPMRNGHQFKFYHQKKMVSVGSFRINFPSRFDILMSSHRELQSAKRIRQLADLTDIADRFNCRVPVNRFICKDLPSTLDPKSIAFVEGVSKVLFFSCPKYSCPRGGRWFMRYSKSKRAQRFMRYCCLREFVRILLGFVIGTSQEKIESAAVELFSFEFPPESREAPKYFLDVSSSLDNCESFNPEFFKQEVDSTIAQSILSAGSLPGSSNYEYISYERNLLEMDRTPIQNILLFVLYWHKRHTTNRGFLIQLHLYLKVIQEMI